MFVEKSGIDYDIDTFQKAFGFTTSEMSPKLRPKRSKYEIQPKIVDDNLIISEDFKEVTKKAGFNYDIEAFQKAFGFTAFEIDSNLDKKKVNFKKPIAKTIAEKPELSEDFIKCIDEAGIDYSIETFQQVTKKAGFNYDIEAFQKAFGFTASEIDSNLDKRKVDFKKPLAKTITEKPELSEDFIKCIDEAGIDYSIETFQRTFGSKSSYDAR
ncbi:unnamed protein product [Diamesa tonsa]